MRIQQLRCLAFSLVLTASPLRAQTPGPLPNPSAAPTPPQSIPAPHVAFQKYTLPNGLQVILVPDPTASRVHLNLWYHVGSKDEPPNRTGFAHLFEHMMFQGSKDAPGSYTTAIEKAGGYSNGTTSQDRTAYTDTVPGGSLEYALWLEADRLATLPEAITADRLDNQKAVVRNELRERLENHPYATLPILLAENLYPAGYPYDHTPIGSHDDVQAATVPDVKQFFRTFYAPNNLSLVVAGDFDPALTRQWIERYFGPIPPAAPTPRPARWTPRLDTDKILDVTDRAAQERLYLAWPVPSFLADDSTHLNVAARILNRRLGASLIYNATPLCTDLETDISFGEDASMFYIIASAAHGASLAAIEASISAEIAALAKTPPAGEELQQARRKLEFDQASHFDTPESTAETLNTGNVFTGNPADFVHQWHLLEVTTSTAVSSAVQANLTSHGRLQIRVHPDALTAQTTSTLDRSVPPPIHPELTVHPPQILSTTLPNGLQILVAPRANAPKVLVRFRTRAGLVAQPKAKDGVALLTAACMPGATTTRSGTQVRGAIEAAGATTISSDVAAEAAGLNFDVLAANLDPAFAVFADVLLHPAFKQSTLNTNLGQFREGLRQAAVNPGDIAEALSRALLYGPGHPYARRIATLKALDNIHPDDLRAFYGTYWKPQGSVLLFVGDITLERATKLAQTGLGTWTGSAPAPAPLPPTKDIGAGHLYLVDIPGATQTLIAQLLPGPGANSPDRLPLSLLSLVWGNMSGSRLEALRETLGDTYGVYAQLNQLSEAGALSAQGPVQTAKTGEAIVELQRQLLRLRDQPVSAADLQHAKQRQLERDADIFANPDSLADFLIGSWNSSVPMAAVQAEPDALQHITLTAVQAATARYLHPQAATYLLIGDRREIEPQLEALHLGPILPLTPDSFPDSLSPTPQKP